MENESEKKPKRNGFGKGNRPTGYRKENEAESGVRSARSVGFSDTFH